MSDQIIAGENNNSNTFISPELLNRKSSEKSSSSQSGSSASFNKTAAARSVLEKERKKRRVKNSGIEYSKPFPFTLFVFCILLDIVDLVASFTVVVSIIINILVALVIGTILKTRNKHIQKDLERLVGIRTRGESPATQRQSKEAVEKNVKRFSEKIVSKSFQRFVIGNLIPIVQFFTLWSLFLVLYYKKEKDFILDGINDGIN